MKGARIETFPTVQALAMRAADLIAGTAAHVPNANIALPTGETPIATYDELARRFAVGDADFARTTIYAVDEFAGAARETAGTNSVFYRQHVRLGQRALHCPNPSAQDPDEHIRAFADAIRRAHGIDLCLLGIGVNGHIAFNEPGSGRDARARVVELTRESREAHARAFGTLDAVPAHGMTLGVADLLESRQIVVLASGAPKAAIVARAIDGPQAADVPGSWLQSVDALWLLDEAAASRLKAQR